MVVLALLLPAFAATPAAASTTPPEAGPAGRSSFASGLAITRAATDTTLVRGTVHAAANPTGTLVAAYEEGDGLTPTAFAVVVGTAATSGTFELPWLPEGTYRLVFLPPRAGGLAAHWSGGVPARSLATPLVVSGDVTAVPDETLRSTATISGRITGPGGTGIGGITVTAFPVGTNWLPVSQTATRPDGTYSLDQLAAGDYQVLVIPPEASGLARTWAPGTGQRSAATVVPLTPGAWVDHVDAPVAPIP